MQGNERSNQAHCINNLHVADSIHGICYIVKNNIYCKNSMSSMVICSSALVLPCHPEVAVGVWHVVLQVWSCSVESSVQEHLKHTHISVGQGLCYCLRLWTVESVQSFIHVIVPACLYFSVLMEYMFQKQKMFSCYLRHCFFIFINNRSYQNIAITDT